MRPRFTLRRSRPKGVSDFYAALEAHYLAEYENDLKHPDYAYIARLEHELSMDGCQWPDSLCAKLAPPPPPHEREMLPGGYWLHLSQCWCRQTVDVTSVFDTHKRTLRLHDPERYKNYVTEWTPSD